MSKVPVRFEVMYEVAEKFDVRSNRWAVEVTLEELACQDRFRPVDAARVQSVRMLASAVDVDCMNAALWGRYLDALRGLMVDDSADDGFAEALAELRSGVRDSSPA